MKPSHKSYPHYGGKGITVCERWRDSFENFLSDMGLRPDGCSLDRIDNGGNYEPDNCRWATAIEQQRNKDNNHHLTAFGETKPLVAWPEDSRCEANLTALVKRIQAGWPEEQAITQPMKNDRRRIRRAVRELERMGYVRDSGARCIGVGGVKVIEWELSEAGVELAESLKQDADVVVTPASQ